MKTICTPLFVCIILASSISPASSQDARNIWCFGHGAEVNFNSASPVSNSACEVSTQEGSASVADASTGQLLFYSDGTTVWDRANNIMPSCTIPLGGNGTTTQSALIIPMPGNTHEYYMFCTDAQAGAAGSGGDSGTQYCIIDMDLHGGMGDITQQPRRLLTPTCEKMAATAMGNNQGYWFVVHQWNSDAFYTYPITIGGIGSPVVSNAGIVMSDPDGFNDNDEAIGYMRISPDQTKIAVACDWVLHTLQVLNFDKNTGRISGPIFSDTALAASNNLNGPYGLCWSPNSQFLYFTIESDYNVQQFNMNAGSPSAILASLTTVGTPSGQPFGLQLASDNKIYEAVYGNSSLDCISSPNNAGAACNYQSAAVQLYSGTSCAIGVPELVPLQILNCTQTSINITANQSHVCGSDSATICAPGGYVAYHWSVAGSDSCISTTRAGSYDVIVTDTNGCSAASNQIIISASTGVTDSITTDKNIFCSSDSTQICALPGFTLYQWSNGVTDTSNCIEANTAGDYYVQVTDSSGCIAQSNHLAISVYPSPGVSISVHGDTLTVFNAVTVQWYLNNNSINNATDSVYLATQSGSYTVEISDTNGCTAISNPVLITVNGINNLTEPNISLYPNPTSDIWQLTVDNSLLGSKLEVFDDNGKIVYESQVSNLKTEIDFNAASGVYLLRIAGDKVSLLRKLVKF